jgi:hypothetical protein
MHEVSEFALPLDGQRENGHPYRRRFAHGAPRCSRVLSQQSACLFTLACAARTRIDTPILRRSWPRHVPVRRTWLPLQSQPLAPGRIFPVR